MESKTATLVGKISYYSNRGTHTITIPKNVIDSLGLQKGDFVDLTITPLRRPSVGEKE